MAMAASDTPANVTGGKGQLNTTYISGRVDEVNLAFGGSHLMLFQQDVPLGLEVHNMLSSSSLTPVGMIAKTAELFGRSALPTSIGPKDPSQFLIPLFHHSQLDIVETIITQPRPGSFTRSFQINGEDMSALFLLNLTTIYMGSPRSRILANVKDRSGDCIAVFRGPEGSQGCVCCCTRCSQNRLVNTNLHATQRRSTMFHNPQQSLTVESPPGHVIGHIALHHDFYGVYNEGMLQLLYSIPFKANNGSGSHTVTSVGAGRQTGTSSDSRNNREQGCISRCDGPHSALKINIRLPHGTHSSDHKLLLVATAICMFGVQTERIPRPLEWLGCIRVRNVLEEGFC
ncbi:uncharacterized protein LOC111250787 isoform X1 [Varroa destructor]|uniref:Phospholipid scramblase n=1 Tax=Varroa destructor TaxID=109461 RepID=A0A7M7MHC7_VARDE|nr:uncharacterized protein LOC111250787 isoform X1 [Varroa destructor]